MILTLRPYENIFLEGIKWIQLKERQSILLFGLNIRGERHSKYLFGHTTHNQYQNCRVLIFYNWQYITLTHLIAKIFSNNTHLNA